MVVEVPLLRIHDEAAGATVFVKDVVEVVEAEERV